MNIYTYLKNKIKALFAPTPTEALIKEHMELIALQNRRMHRMRSEWSSYDYDREIITTDQSIEDIKLCITVGNNAINELEGAYSTADEALKKEIDIKIDYLRAKIANLECNLRYYEENMEILIKSKNIELRRIRNLLS